MLLLPEQVSLAEFILALEEEEAKELSNLFDPCGTDTDGTKLQQALDRALCQINGSFAVAGNCGKALIKLNAKNYQIWIARHLLDTVKARPQVREDFERASEELKEYACYDQEKGACPLSDEDLAEILGSPPPKTDSNFRFGSDCRKWNKRTLRSHQRQHFDHKSVQVFTTDEGCCPDDKCCD